MKLKILRGGRSNGLFGSIPAGALETMKTILKHLIRTVLIVT